MGFVALKVEHIVRASMRLKGLFVLHQVSDITNSVSMPRIFMKGRASYPHEKCRERETFPRPKEADSPSKHIPI
jgi:hypothetical protein